MAAPNQTHHKKMNKFKYTTDNHGNDDEIPRTHVKATNATNPERTHQKMKSKTKTATAADRPVTSRGVSLYDNTGTEPSSHRIVHAIQRRWPLILVVGEGRGTKNRTRNEENTKSHRTSTRHRGTNEHTDGYVTRRRMKQEQQQRDRGKRWQGSAHITSKQPKQKRHKKMQELTQDRKGKVTCRGQRYKPRKRKKIHFDVATREKKMATNGQMHGTHQSDGERIGNTSDAPNTIPATKHST
jgi:hypothetical protein